MQLLIQIGHGGRVFCCVRATTAATAGARRYEHVRVAKERLMGALVEAFG